MDSSNRLLRFALVAILLFAALLVFAIVTAIFQPGLLNLDLSSGDESTPSLESDVSFEAADKTPLDANCSYPQAIDASAQLARCIERANTNPDATTLELAGDLLLTSALPAIDSEIVLQGNSFIIDGGGEHRLFDVSNTGRLTIISAILQNGSGSKGGAIRNLGQLEIMESKILSNTAVSGGGIYNGSGGRVQITASQLSGNTGVFGGGGLYNEGEGAEVQVANSQFDENASPNAGGGAVANLDGAGLLITKTHFISNSASFHGGAIYNTTAGIVRLSGVILMGNTAVESSGGAISNSDNGSTVILVSSSVISNTGVRISR